MFSNRALNRALLARQGLLERQAVPPLTMIERLGGLQAQQARPPFVGLWSRLEGFRREQLIELLEAKTVVRALFWRGTLHLLSANDFHAWRESIQPMLTAGMRSILKERVRTFDAELVLAHARKQFGNGPRTFTELRNALVEAFPDGGDRAMGYFVRTHLPLVSVPTKMAWGFPADAEFQMIPSPSKTKPSSIVKRYLAAFGPATVADFQAWSGYKGAQALFDKEDLEVFPGRKTFYDVSGSPRPDEDVPAPVRFIAEFDNLILSHADRTRIISEEHRPKVVTKNLLVLGTFLVDGFVAGIWKVDRKKTEAKLHIQTFIKVSAAAQRDLKEEGDRLTRFLEPDASTISIDFR